MAQQQTMRRLQKLASKVRELVGTNTTTSPASGAYTDEGDVSMILRTAGILSDGLQVLDSATVAWDPWQASTAYTVDQVAEPVTRNGYRYAVSTAGTSGTTEPTWPTTVDTTVADGDVTWACVGKLPYGMWDDAYTQWTVEMGLLSGLYTGNQGGISLSSVVHTWGLATQTSGVDTGAVGVWLVTPAPTNGHVYLLDGGIDSVRGFNPWPAAQPNWSTSGGTVQDDEGSFWADLGPYWESATAVPEGNTAIWFALDNTANPAVIGMTCTTAGTTGTTEPVWPMVAGETVTDGTVVWTSVTISSPTVPVKPGYAPAEQYYARWTSMMDDVGAAAEVIPSNFDSAGTKGDGCWRDWNDNAGWWVFQAPEDDYLPVQNGHYYHASIMGVDETGDPYVHSTQEFGFGLKVGCPELLVPGDTVTIKIHGAATTATGQGYQPGDNFSVRINHALPIAFVGGVTGDDTLTFSVRGSQSGRLDDYPLVTTALAAYSHSGLDFAITPGGIPFALGDSFRFSVESGQFQWRRDGGAWAAAADLADVALADGLTVAFAGGTAPSWVAGDAWTFAAEAVNGPAHLTTPDDTRCAWSEATTLDVTPSTAGPVRGILIAGHAIPANATITITGSDDGFATTPFTAAVPWRSGTIWQALTGGSYAAYRLAISAAGSARWVWLGDPLTLAIRSGNPEFGMLVKRWRLPALGKALGLGGTVTHSALSQTSMDGLLDALAAACTDDAAQFGVVPHDDGADAALVHYAEDSLEVDDEFGHQGDSDTRLLSVSLSMEAA